MCISGCSGWLGGWAGWLGWKHTANQPPQPRILSPAQYSQLLIAFMVVDDNYYNRGGKAANFHQLLWVWTNLAASCLTHVFSYSPSLNFLLQQCSLPCAKKQKHFYALENGVKYASLRLLDISHLTICEECFLTWPIVSVTHLHVVPPAFRIGCINSHQQLTNHS